MAGSLNNLGNLAHGQGDLEGARRYYQQALGIRQKMAPGSLDVAESLNNLAWLMNQQGKPAEAEALYRESLAIRRRALGNNSQEVAQSLNNLAKTLMQKADYAVAEPLLRESLAIYVKLYGEQAADTAVAAAQPAADAGQPACTPEQATAGTCTPPVNANGAASDQGGIVVTGSRIRRPNVNSPVPVVSLSGEEFFQQGQNNIGDTLNELPQLRSTFSQVTA